MRQRLAIVLLVPLLVIAAGVTAPIPSYDPNTYLTSLRLLAGVALLTLLLNALRLVLAEETATARVTDTGAKIKFPWTWEQRLLFVLFLLALMVYGYAKFAEATSLGVALVTVCLVALNVGVAAWLMRQWYKSVS